MTRENIVEVKTVTEVPVYIEVEVPVEPSGDLWIDSFTQSSTDNGIDIIWVIDTSGSMDDHEPELLGGITAMIGSLPPTGWRLVMIPATPGNASQSQQFPLVPGDDIIDAELMLTNMLSGNGESGFDSIYSYIVENNYSDIWMRQDAALLVVFVSDEEEQSSIRFHRVVEFINWYSSLRSSVFLSSIINLHPVDSLCSPGPDEVGLKYIQATQNFGGVVIDICGDDWGPGVSAASSLTRPVEEIELTYTPVQSTIRVFKNRQISAQWTYDRTSNKIIFSIVPGAGELVEIAYIIDVGN